MRPEPPGGISEGPFVIVSPQMENRSMTSTKCLLLLLLYFGEMTWVTDQSEAV